MSLERVWSRFEVKGKDGTALKLRIQDTPSNKNDEVIELFIKYFKNEEPISKAAGYPDSEPLSDHVRFLNSVLKDPLHRISICCADDSDRVNDILGVCLTFLVEASDDSTKVEEPTLKVLKILKELSDLYDPIREFNLNQAYYCGGLFVVPQCRGLGIAQQLLKVRRIRCAADGVPLTGAWMTAYGTQIAAARDGWETVKELSYDYLGEKYGVTFTDVPPTLKYMIAKFVT